MPNRRELYRSADGDCWFLGREPQTGHAFVIHQPNAPSGGRLSPSDRLGSSSQFQTSGTIMTLRPARIA